MKYRIREYDPIHDIYILEHQIWWIFWREVSVGNKKSLEDFILAEKTHPTQRTRRESK